MMKKTNKVDVKNIYTILIKHDTAKANVKVACRVIFGKSHFLKIVKSAAIALLQMLLFTCFYPTFFKTILFKAHLKLLH